MKILIIEDESALQKSIRKYLTGLGNICSAASSYAREIEQVKLFITIACFQILRSAFLVFSNGQTGRRNSYNICRKFSDDKLTGISTDWDFFDRFFSKMPLKNRVLEWP